VVRPNYGSDNTGNLPKMEIRGKENLGEIRLRLGKRLGRGPRRQAVTEHVEPAVEERGNVFN